jgi:hypothetical protein
MSAVRFGVEGDTDVPVAEALIRHVGRTPRLVLVAGGRTRLDERLRQWNQPGNRAALLVLRDWDAGERAGCVPEHLSIVLGGDRRAHALALRIPVRATESWLMADVSAFRQYFKTEPPARPDEEPRPKLALVNACRRSRSSSVRRDMVPRDGDVRAVGELYSSRLIEFGRDYWSIARALPRSPSLSRSVLRLRSLVDDGVW